MNSILHRVLRKLAATSICPHLQISIQQQWELGNEKSLLQTLHREGKKLGSHFSYGWGGPQDQASQSY